MVKTHILSETSPNRIMSFASTSEPHSRRWIPDKLDNERVITEKYQR